MVCDSLIIANVSISQEGLIVLSEEYSNPSFNILINPGFPMVVDSHSTIAFFPVLKLVIPTTDGSFLYPLPPFKSKIFEIGPFEFFDFVV